MLKVKGYYNNFKGKDSLQIKISNRLRFLFVEDEKTDSGKEMKKLTKGTKQGLEQSDESEE